MFRLLYWTAGLILVIGVEDFDDVLRSFEFIYHDTANLLLAVYRDNCYFVTVHDTNNERTLLVTYKRNTETHIIELIRQRSQKVHSSSLDIVRNNFQDLLADFHCVEKTIFTVHLDGDDVRTILYHASGNPG